MSYHYVRIVATDQRLRCDCVDFQHSKIESLAGRVIGPKFSSVKRSMKKEA